jgi:hypothetical protein
MALMLSLALPFSAARADGFLAAGLGVSDAKFSFGGAAMIVLSGSLDGGALVLNPSLEADVLSFGNPIEPVLDVGLGLVYWRGLFLASYTGLKAHALINITDLNRSRFGLGGYLAFFLIPVAFQVETVLYTDGGVTVRLMLYWFFKAI